MSYPYLDYSYVRDGIGIQRNGSSCVHAIIPRLRKLGSKSHGINRPFFLLPQKLTGVHVGRIDDTADAFVRRSRELTGKGSSVIHTITPAEITVHQEKAIAEAPASIMIRFEKDEHQYELISNCRLMYRLSRVDEVGWKINELTVIYVRDMIVPVAPMATSFSPDLTGFRGSYKFLTWTLQHRQVPISQELPGVDRPDTIVHLQEEQTQWLCAP